MMNVTNSNKLLLPQPVESIPENQNLMVSDGESLIRKVYFCFWTSDLWPYLASSWPWLL